MIFYFTGTGNSKYAASVIADTVDDKKKSIGWLLKRNEPLKFESEKPYVIVFPIYAWNIPKIVADFVNAAEFKGSNEMYFVGTMASSSADCDLYCEKLARANNMRFMGFSGVRMPGNFVIAQKVADRETNEKIIFNATPNIRHLAHMMLDHKRITRNEKFDSIKFPALHSGVMNRQFQKHFNAAKHFIVFRQCIGCGRCVNVCPTNNIKMKNGYPVFGDNCANCLACLHRCPQAAINYRRITAERGRWSCPEYIPKKKDAEEK